MSKTSRGQFFVTLCFENDKDLFEWIERKMRTKWGTVSRAAFIRAVLRREMEEDAND